MRAMAGFDAAMQRAEHLVTLYDLLSDRRIRSVRRGWATKFRELMRWRKREKFARVDGNQCILILREKAGISRSHFSDEYLSELLRSAIVAAVSAMDRYFHDAVVSRCWTMLTRPEGQIPKELRALDLPALETARALAHLRRDPKARPGNLVKKAIQDKLHNDFTSQGPDSILKAANMLAVKDFWQTVADQMSNKPKKGEVIAKLRSIAFRRNQIVHEADLERKTRSKHLTLRPITHRHATESIAWIRSFVTTVDSVFGQP